MSRVELLTVEDSFSIEGRGLVVIPDFPVPNGWKNRTEVVTVTRPDGHQYDAEAQFSMSHFRLLDRTAPIEKRWRVVILLLNKNRDDLPAGSRIAVSTETRDAILSQNVA